MKVYAVSALVFIAGFYLLTAIEGVLTGIAVALMVLACIAMSRGD